MTLVPLTFLALTWPGGCTAGLKQSRSRPEAPGDSCCRAPGDPFEHPPFRALVLSREKPEDVSEKVAYRGTSRRYAQIRFGSPGSIRVTVVLDEVGPGDVDLYVDANRDRKIDDRDRVAGTKGSFGREQVWRLPLDVAMVEGERDEDHPRALVFRLGADRADPRLRRGRLPRGDRHDGRASRESVRRMDGDGNGLMTDAQDRLWIDLNRDGRWDAGLRAVSLRDDPQPGGCALRRPFRPRSGQRLALEPLVGTGTVQLALKNGQGHRPARDPGRPRRLGLRPLRQRAGDRAGRRVPAEHGHGRVRRSPGRARAGRSSSPTTAPRVTRDGTTSARTSRSRSTRSAPSRWGSNVADKAKTVKAGEDVSVQPLLYTGDGLLINVAYRGTPTRPPRRKTWVPCTTLAATDGQALGTAHSGFA